MSVSQEEALVEGALIGKRFRLERLLGRGAAGSVWLATHLALSSLVAVKFLDQIVRSMPSAADLEGHVDRFRFEAQVSARLSARTRHTVAVHDAGLFRGVPFLVMEYAPGRSLEEALESQVTGTLPNDELIKVAEQIGEALGEAHALGIVHRDVKAANILQVDRAGHESLYKLADFGIARLTGERALDLTAPMKTTEGLIVGTPAYMSPEQIGAEGVYGPTSDLWALGVVLYEAMTGRVPFVGISLVELAMAISGRPHDPPARPDGGCSPAIGAFFDRALAKRPVDRFESAAEMTRAFRAALTPQDEPITVEVRKPNRIAFVGIGLVAAVIGLGVWFVHSSSVSSAELSPKPSGERSLSTAEAVTGEMPSARTEGPSVTPRASPNSPASAAVDPKAKAPRSATVKIPAPLEPAKSAAEPPVSVQAPPPIPTVHRGPVDKSETQ